MAWIDDKKAFALSIGVGFVIYNVTKYGYKLYKSSKRRDFVPIGIIKELNIYPIKSCRSKQVFSLYCGKYGVECGGMRDRFFQIINGETGLFYTARQKPKMILIESEMKDNTLIVKFPDGKTCVIDLNIVTNENKVIRTTLFEKKKQDGLDCGEEISKLLSDYIDEPNTRLVVYMEHLYTERTLVPKKEWWMNNTVPKNKFNVPFSDLAPYMALADASLTDLNTRLEKKLTMKSFRPNIVIEKCPAYDEDKWDELRIGDVQLQCCCPCTRCILTTVDPETGIRDKNNQPLQTLRSYRGVPEGCMRAEFKDDPVFGVNLGLLKPGYIHIGQVVYARYKDSEF